MIPRVALALALVAPLAPEAAATEANLRRLAIVVGANDGGDARVTLRYAHDDARAFAQVLTDLGGLAPADRILLFDPDPAALEAAFARVEGWVGQESERRTEVLFYYSGHSDEEGLLLGEDRVLYPWVRERLDAVDADVRVAVLDSCASGAMVRRKGGARVPAFAIDQSSAVEGYAYLTSSSADEAAQEADRIGGSYFTHYLTTGLRGAADVSGDGRVTLHEAYRFAFDETLHWTERSQIGPQHPTYDFQLAGTGDLVLTDLTQGTASLILGAEVDGRTTVRDEAGRLVAELVKPAGRPIELGLGAGRYKVTVSREGRFAETAVELVDGERETLGLDALAWRDGELAVARGGGSEAPSEQVVPVRVGLIPIRAAANTVDRLGLDVLVGRSERLDGGSIGFGGHVVDGDARGPMVAIGGHLVGGDLDGAQVSVGYNQVGGDAGHQLTVGANVVGGSVRGSQLSVGANLAGRDLRGVQLTSGLNLAGGVAHGIQGAAGANVAVGGLHGAQLAAGLNVAGGPSRGLQGSAGVNVADSLRGAQIGIVNVGRVVRGAQIGVVNVGGRVHGAQIGVVNIADDVHGAPIGLLSFVRQGRLDLGLYASEVDPMNVELKFGGRSLYTVIGLGTDAVDQHHLAFGLGAHAPAGRAWVDVDLAALSYVDTLPVTVEAPTLTARLRVATGVQLTGAIAPYAGLSLNVDPGLGADPGTRPDFLWAERDAPPGAIVGWAGAFVGLQLGRPLRPHDHSADE